MSLILDALRKAQEERRLAGQLPNENTGIVRLGRSRRFFYLLALPLVLLGILLLIPGLRHVFMGIGDGLSKPGSTRQPSTLSAVSATNRERSPGDRDAESAAGQNGQVRNVIPDNHASEITGFVTSVPKGAAQDPTSALSPRPGDQAKKDFSGTDVNQSILVKRIDGKDRPTDLYNRALRATELGRYDEARRSYMAVLTERPDDAEALNNLGVLFMERGRHREALRYFTMALDSKADYSKVHNNLGILYMKEGRQLQAEEHLRRAVKLDPDATEPYLNLSALLRSEGRFKEASDLLTPVVEGRREARVHLSYAIIHDEMADYRGALTHYHRYLDQSPAGSERQAVAERIKVLETLPDLGATTGRK